MMMMSVFLQVLSGKRRMELLPGDRDNLAIQTRGGPEKHEVTGWVLVSDTHFKLHYTYYKHVFIHINGTYTHRVLIHYTSYDLFSYDIFCTSIGSEPFFHSRSLLWPKTKRDRTSVMPPTQKEKLQPLDRFTWSSPLMTSSRKVKRHHHTANNVTQPTKSSLKGPVIWRTTGSCNLKRSSDWWCHFLSVTKEDELWSADHKDKSQETAEDFFPPLSLNSDKCLVWTLLCLNLFFCCFLNLVSVTFRWNHFFSLLTGWKC